MRLILPLLFFTSLFAGPHINYQSHYANLYRAKDPRDNLILLTQQRAGSHWMQASIQYLTRRPVLPFEIYRMQHKVELEEFGFNILNLELDQTQRPFFRLHHADRLSKVIRRVETYSQKNRLILLLRDYKEAIPRHLKSCFPDQEINTCLKNNPRFIDQLTDRLRLYEKWHPKNRFLIYYEDLINDPEPIYTALLDFLETPKTHLEDFLTNLDSLKSQSLSHYNTIIPGGSHTSGSTTPFHSKDLTKKTRKWFDHYLQTRAPKLYAKYLTRYHD